MNPRCRTLVSICFVPTSKCGNHYQYLVPLEVGTKQIDTKVQHLGFICSASEMFHVACVNYSKNSFKLPVNIVMDMLNVLPHV